MARYNQWLNTRLYAVCQQLSDADRKADKQLFFGTIHHTLNHILWGDTVWLSRFEQSDDAIPALGEELYSDFAQLALARQECDSQIIHWATNVDKSWLEGAVTYTSKSTGKQYTKPAWLLATHLFNHETHHRGQVTAVLSQMGLDYGVTDLPFMDD